MASSEKVLERMKNNPRDWRIENLVAVATRYRISHLQRGTSHVTFRHPAATKVTVPSARPIKPVYIKHFLEMVETVKGATSN